MGNEQETHGNVLFLACSKLLPVDPALAWNTPSASQHLHRTNPSGDAATQRKSQRVSKKQLSKNTLALTGQERASGGGHRGKGGGREEQQQEPAVRSHRGPHRKQELAAADALSAGRWRPRGEWKLGSVLDLGRRRRRRWRRDAGCTGRPHARHDVRAGGACKLKSRCHCSN